MILTQLLDKNWYAKALIEVTLDKPLLLHVQKAPGHVAEVCVRYGWTPDICTTCRSFGHLAPICSAPVLFCKDPPLVKIPLPRPPLHNWVPITSKIAQSNPLVVSPPSDKDNKSSVPTPSSPL